MFFRRNVLPVFGYTNAEHFQNGKSIELPRSKLRHFMWLILEPGIAVLCDLSLGREFEKSMLPGAVFHRVMPGSFPNTQSFLIQKDCFLVLLCKCAATPHVHHWTVPGNISLTGQHPMFSKNHKGAQHRMCWGKLLCDLSGVMSTFF